MKDLRANGAVLHNICSFGPITAQFDLILVDYASIESREARSTDYLFSPNVS